MSLSVNRNVCFIALIGIVVLIVTSILLAGAAHANGARVSGRLAPPDAVTCDRNFLTSWTGIVSEYRENEDRTSFTIHTDENTVEKVTLNHEGRLDVVTRFLLWGETFTQADWSQIERSPGVLIDAIRATAWVCDTGVTTIFVDWQPPIDEG